MERELETLGKDLGSVDSQLELAGESSVSSLATKPPWIDDKVSNAMLCLPHCIAGVRMHVVVVQGDETSERYCTSEDTGYGVV